MLQATLQYFSLAFPHTFVRLAYWHFLLSHDNTGLLDPHSMILAILPCCIYHINEIAANRTFADDDDEAPLEFRPGPFRVINGCITYWFLMYKARDLVAALDVVLRASGFGSKILLAIDLFVESTLVLLAKTTFFISVGLFVGAALEGFPYVWRFAQAIFRNLQNLPEGLFGRNDIPVGDPFLEE